MNRPSFVIGLLAVTTGAFVAFADERTPVKTSASVEVLDDAAHVDDVISRMKQPEKKANLPNRGNDTDLKKERPPLAGERTEKEKREEHEKKEAVWRAKQERTANPERTERAQKKN